MASTVEWQTGTPQEPAWYLVAILYKNGMGTFGCATWDAGYGWSLEDNIIGYIPINSLTKAAGAEWPEHLMPEGFPRY